MVRLGACDCPTCPNRALIIERPENSRCPVCGWLLRPLTPPESPDEETDG